MVTYIRTCRFCGRQYSSRLALLTSHFWCEVVGVIDAATLGRGTKAFVANAHICNSLFSFLASKYIQVPSEDQICYCTNL